MKPTLVILAAGIGSRFGQGIKQLEPVGPNGEIIMDYSIHDALEAGFGKIVFIIRKSIETDFREIIGARIGKKAETAYVFQELDSLPEGFSLPEGRTKPWGTGHALLCCRGVVKEPFAVINADDYYGKEAFRTIARFLTEERLSVPGAGGEPVLNCCMAGFLLKNTLSDSGTVTRGICRVDEEGYLRQVLETYDIQAVRPDSDGNREVSEVPEGRRGQSAPVGKEEANEPVLGGCLEGERMVERKASEKPGARAGAGADRLAKGTRNGEEVLLNQESLVSINMWGMPAEYLDTLERRFKEFLALEKADPLKAEFLIPTVMDSQIREGHCTVKALRTGDRWFGMTYKEDVPAVKQAIRELISAGAYPEAL